jgi:hypothetical protein
MKKVTSYTMIALLATIAVSIATPNMDAIMQNEKAAWQAYKDKKADDFKKVVDHDMMGIYAQGISDMTKEMTDMQKWDMKSFAINDYKILSDEKDVIVATYTVTLAGTYDGQDASGTYNAGTVWKQENGKWLAIFHTNIKQTGTTGDAQRKE